MLSETARYALRAIVCLAERAEEGRMRVNELALELSIPQNYLSKILHQLARAGVLQSSRGPKGGFTLSVPADELTLARVIDPVSPQQPGLECLLGRSECRDDDPCPAHESWKPIAEQLRRFFHETTVADLARRWQAVKETEDANDRPEP